MSGVPAGPWRDARRLPRPPRDARRVEPRESTIWVRVDGRWLPGHIQCWFTHRGRWACWLSYQADPAHPTVAAMWGLFAYEPMAILSRAAHPTPPEPPEPAREPGPGARRAQQKR
ncbi:hypothetical protein ABH935_007245 [Catenulispora sp. GAS73]|uniref:hypothetical protein n=1 Tax=Catenulispora sp. GAS73 TaxID=3156269 RepID=UPI003512B12D